MGEKRRRGWVKGLDAGRQFRKERALTITGPPAEKGKRGDAIGNAEKKGESWFTGGLSPLTIVVTLSSG